VPLNKTGYRQAENLRDKLAEQGVRFSAAMTSPLVRAVETAKVLLQGSHVIAQDNLALIELDMGDYEGRKEKDVRDLLGNEKYNQWRSTMMRVPAPGGESITDVAYRLQSVVTWLGQQIGNVLIVGHQYVNMALKAQLCNRFDSSDLLEFKQANDEIDIWDHQSRRSIGLIKLDNFDGEHLRV
jgi:broad specificity phosphatase PhoE